MKQVLRVVVGLGFMMCGCAMLNGQAPAARPAELPPDSQYVQARGPHLYMGEQRVRYWGTVGGFPGMSHADADEVLGRIQDMGFNMVRYWRRGVEYADYVKGDGSAADRYDYFMARAGERGVRFWMPGVAAGHASPADVDIIDDPETRAAWIEAVGERVELQSVQGIWDPRLKALQARQIERVGNHVNQYTGRRWADEPYIVIWELTNEQWLFAKLVAGHWQRLHPFFQRQLAGRWNQWLLAKYGDEAALRARWGFLLEGESLADGTVLIAPLRSDISVGAMREALGVREQEGVAQEYGRSDFNAYRANDVIEFFLQLWVEHKKSQYELVKTLGKSMRLSPLVMDTGIGYEIGSQYMQQYGDAIAHDTYITAFHHGPGHKRFPWISGLEELPRMCWEVQTPWVEQNRHPNKPYLIYETQMEQPAKYRAEYPMRIAALGAIQDWDVVIWHYFGGIPEAGQDRPYDRKLDKTSSEQRHPQGLHFQYDEVQMAAMRTAAAIFTQGLLKPAPEPTTFIFGRKSLLHPDSMDYGGSYGRTGLNFISTVYRYGMRLVIDPTREDDQIIGPTFKPRQYEPSPIAPHDQISYDWQRGHLKFDAPAVAGYTGFLAQYGSDRVGFANNDVTLSNVRVRNDENMPYPVAEDEMYISFALATLDGRPLAESNRAILSLVSTSFNDGFELNHDKLRNEFVWQRNPGATVSLGDFPVRVARVGGTVRAPSLSGMRYVVRDWHMQELSSGEVSEDGTLNISADQKAFVIELSRD